MGFHPGKGLGIKTQGRIYFLQLPAHDPTFGLGYKPSKTTSVEKESQKSAGTGLTPAAREHAYATAQLCLLSDPHAGTRPL